MQCSDTSSATWEFCWKWASLNPLRELPRLKPAISSKITPQGSKFLGKSACKDRNTGIEKSGPIATTPPKVHPSSRTPNFSSCSILLPSLCSQMLILGALPNKPSLTLIFISESSSFGIIYSEITCSQGCHV